MPAKKGKKTAAKAAPTQHLPPPPRSKPAKPKPAAPHSYHPPKGYHLVSDEGAARSRKAAKTKREEASAMMALGALGGAGGLALLERVGITPQIEQALNQIPVVGPVVDFLGVDGIVAAGALGYGLSTGNRVALAIGAGSGAIFAAKKLITFVGAEAPAQLPASPATPAVKGLEGLSGVDEVGFR